MTEVTEKYRCAQRTKKWMKQINDNLSQLDSEKAALRDFYWSRHFLKKAVHRF